MQITGLFSPSDGVEVCQVPLRSVPQRISYRNISKKAFLSSKLHMHEISHQNGALRARNAQLMYGSILPNQLTYTIRDYGMFQYPVKCAPAGNLIR